jgi:hypothetical protein
MSAERCPREEELLDALGRGFVGAELDEHVASCVACSELQAVAGALLDDRREAMLEAPVPSAGTMWWRIRVRRRHDAEARARQSMVIGQAATLAIAFALVITFFGADIASKAREMLATIRLSTPMLLAVATSVLLAPIAGWMALRQK